MVEIAVNGTGYTLTNDYYYLGQFSKFLKRGSIVLAGTGNYDYGSNSAGINYKSSGSGYVLSLSSAFLVGVVRVIG